MPKYRVTVTETILESYAEVEIEAESEEAAEELAEGMRVSGALGEPGFLSVEDIAFSVSASEES